MLGSMYLSLPSSSVHYPCEPWIFQHWSMTISSNQAKEKSIAWYLHARLRHITKLFSNSVVIASINSCQHLDFHRYTILWVIREWNVHAWVYIILCWRNNAWMSLTCHLLVQCTDQVIRMRACPSEAVPTLDLEQ